MDPYQTAEALLVIVFAILGAICWHIASQFPMLWKFGLSIRESAKVSAKGSVLAAINLGLLLFILDPAEPYLAGIIAALFLGAFLLSIRIPQAVNISLRNIRATPYYIHEDMVKIFPLVTAAAALAIVKYLL